MNAPLAADFRSFVKLWDFYHRGAAHLSGSKLRKLCQTNFLSYIRMREWHDTHQQLHGLVAEMGLGKPAGHRRVRQSDDRPDAGPPLPPAPTGTGDGRPPRRRRRGRNGRGPSAAHPAPADRSDAPAGVPQGSAPGTSG